MTTETPKYHNIVLSGGSVRGISHIGALSKLVEAKLVDFSKLKAIAGSSVGSVIATLIVLGYSVKDLSDFIYQLDIPKLVKPDIMLLINKYGVDNGHIIYNLFEKIITERTNVKHISFLQLYELTGIHLTITGTCLTTKQVVYYDHINTPSFKVSVAMRISIGMPGFFTPIDIDGLCYVDGSVMNDYPINLFEDDIEHTIGIRINDIYDTSFSCFESYFSALMKLFMYNYYQTSPEYNDNTINIVDTDNKTNIFNFNINNDTKTILYQSGYDQCQKYIELHDLVN